MYRCTGAAHMVNIIHKVVATQDDFRRKVPQRDVKHGCSRRTKRDVMDVRLYCRSGHGNERASTEYAVHIGSNFNIDWMQQFPGPGFKLAGIVTVDIKDK